MLRVRIAAVGKLKEKFFRDAADEYLKRLSKFAKVEIIELQDFADQSNPEEREGRLILQSLSGRVILADIGGAQYTSEEFSRHIEKLTLDNSIITFVIGGSNGVSDAVRARADERISFSQLTFPHQLFRVVLLEQLYRAFTIMNNTNYHK